MPLPSTIMSPNKVDLVHRTPGLHKTLPRVEPVSATEQSVFEIMGMTLSTNGLRDFSYQVFQFADCEVRKLLRCSECLVRLKSMAARSKARLTPAEKKIREAAHSKIHQIILEKLKSIQPLLTWYDACPAQSSCGAEFEKFLLETEPEFAASRGLNKERIAASYAYEAANNGRHMPWPAFEEPQRPTWHQAEDGSWYSSIETKEYPEPDRNASHFFENVISIDHKKPWARSLSIKLPIEMEHWDLFQSRDIQSQGKKAICQSHPKGPKNGVFQCCQEKIGHPGCLQKDTHGKGFSLEDTKKDYKMFETVRGVAVDERHAIAIDCEMGFSVRGEVELIQIAAVDFFTGEVLLDSLVWPDVKMRHLQTRHSGVTWKMLNAAARTKTCLWGRKAARDRLLQFVGPDTVIITHAGKNDLMALRWIHPWIVDTMELEKRRMGRVTQAWRQPSLMKLAKLHLGRDIQQNVGHDCLEDCITTRDLAVFYMKVLPADDKISDNQKFLLRIGELQDPRETVPKDTCASENTLDEDTRTWEELRNTRAGESARDREKISVREDTPTWEDDREDDTRPGEDTQTWEHMGDHFGYYLTKEEAYADSKLPALYWPPTMAATPKDQDPVTPGNEAAIDCLDLSNVNAALDLEAPASWKSLAPISPKGKAKPPVTWGCDGAGAPKSAFINLETPASSQGPCETLISSGKAPTSPVIKYFGDNWDVKAPAIGDSWGSAHVPPKVEAPFTHKVKVLPIPQAQASASVTKRKPPVTTLKDDPEVITRRAAYIWNDTVPH